MKIQGLAVLAIIIILPMSILLNNYSRNQIKTLRYQVSYDNKLMNATYDGIKAFQLNMSDDREESEADSKLREIEAAIKTFYNSLANQFEMSGYGESVLKDYIPALVYTLYDGYYIYSEYKNVLSENDDFYYDADLTDEQKADIDFKDEYLKYVEYDRGAELYGLKPYIYYSCRYVKDDPTTNGCDVVITYTLDSFISIQGMVKGNEVNTSRIFIEWS